jgi:hypothetical protein
LHVKSQQQRQQQQQQQWKWQQHAKGKTATRAHVLLVMPHLLPLPQLLQAIAIIRTCWK